MISTHKPHFEVEIERIAQEHEDWQRHPFTFRLLHALQHVREELLAQTLDADDPYETARLKGAASVSSAAYLTDLAFKVFENTKEVILSNEQAAVQSVRGDSDVEDAIRDSLGDVGSSEADRHACIDERGAEVPWQQFVPSYKSGPG